MNRLIVLGFAIAGAGLTGLWVVLELAGASLATRIGAAAAVVQAITAIVIVLLSWELARTARDALIAAETQAKAAREAVDEAQRASRDLRVERELSVLPLLDLTIGTSRDETHPIGLGAGAAPRDDSKLDLSFKVANLSFHPATGVSVIALRGPWDGRPPDSSNARDGQLMGTAWTRNAIPAGGEPPEHVWQIPDADLPEVLVLRLQYSGILGATVWQTYEQDLRIEQPYTWNASQRYIQPSVKGADPIVSELR